MSNRRQGHSEVQYPMAQKQSCRVACLPGVWKALVRFSAPEGEQKQAHRHLFSMRNTTHRLEDLSAGAQAS